MDRRFNAIRVAHCEGSAPDTNDDEVVSMP